MGALRRDRNAIMCFMLIAALALTFHCGKPEIKKPHSRWADARIPEAVKANEEAREKLNQYRGKYGPKEEYGLLVEKDVNIPLRDGTILKADIFRPDAKGKYPIIMSMTAYMKDRPWPVPEDHEAKPGKYQVWEVPNPERWVPWGYVLIRIDTRGFGKSPGKPAGLNEQEAKDYYDAIEWAARQPWSNGRVGLSGVSYIAINQWYVAAEQPPSLKAIIPWEGLADQYRDTFFRGGIFCFTFVMFYMGEFYRDYAVRSWPVARVPDRFSTLNIWNFISNRFDNEFWRDRQADWKRIKVPLFSAANWNGWMGAGHLRGNMEGFKRAASKHKKLRVHTGGHQDSYYSEEGFMDQLRFFDYWLKEIDNGLMDEPPVKLAVRHGTDRFDFEWRYENEWPLARTRYEKLYLSASENGRCRLLGEKPTEEDTVTYDAPGGYKDKDNMVLFVSDPFDEDTEITGEIKLNLWVSSTANDMKVHAVVLIVQPTLHPLLHMWYGEREIVTLGWLSAQHRELDPKLSTDSRPYHRHKRLLPLEPGKPVEIQVEIWPTSMVYREGSRLALAISSDNPMTMQQSPVGLYRARHAKDTIHTGGTYNSYLQIPVVPPKE